MFRNKDAETDAATGGFRRPVSDASKPTPQPELPAGSAGVTPASGAAEPMAGAPAPHADTDRFGKRLIVGEGIRLSGEISSCHRLVVQGEVEVTLNDTLALEITEGRHLCVRGTGKLTGTIRYAELELERGGQIAGNVSVISPDGAGGKTGSARVVDRRSPMFTEGSSEQDAPKAS